MWSANNGIGYGQTWRELTGSSIGCNAVRAAGVTCINTTGKPILVNAVYVIPNSGGAAIEINGATVGYQSNTGTGGVGSSVHALVPVSTSYTFLAWGGAYLAHVRELR